MVQMYQEHTISITTVYHNVLSDCLGNTDQNIAGASGIELPILFASIKSIDTFVSIGDFDTMSIVSPIPIEQTNHETLQS